MFTRRDLCVGVSAVAGAASIPNMGHAAGKPLIVRVPLSFASNGMPLMQLTINGKGPYRFLIDTGAFSSLIRESLAKELSLRTGGSIRTASLKGHENSYIYRAPNVVVSGGLPFGDMTFVGMENFKMKGVDGILPASFLTGIPSQLDYEAAEIRYYLNGAEMDLDGFRHVKGFYQADRKDFAEKVYVYVTLDGKKMVCCVDTGAGSALLASGAFVERNDLWGKFPLLFEGKGRGANGQTVATRMVRATNVAVGDLVLPAMPVTLVDPKGGDSLHRSGIDGLVGTPFLKHFTVAFNARKELYLKPNASYARLTNTMPEMDAPEEVAPGTAAIPFLYGEARKIMIPGRFGDKPALPFVLTTGNATSAIDPVIASALGLAKGADGGFDASQIEFGSVRLPRLKLQPRTEPYAAKASLGLDFLLAMPSGLDFDANLLTFFVDAAPDRTGYVKTGAVREVRDETGQSRLYIKARLDGQDLDCRIDTNAQMALFLPPQTVKARNLWDRFPDAENRQGRNDEGRIIRTRFVKGPEFEIAGVRIAVSPLTLSDPTQLPDGEDRNVDGVIGMGILRRFNILFDTDGGMWIRQNTHFV